MMMSLGRVYYFPAYSWCSGLSYHAGVGQVRLRRSVNLQAAVSCSLSVPSISSLMTKADTDESRAMAFLIEARSLAERIIANSNDCEPGRKEGRERKEEREEEFGGRFNGKRYGHQSRKRSAYRASTGSER
jgi:hypothetical protein